MDWDKIEAWVQSKPSHKALWEMLCFLVLPAIFMSSFAWLLHR